MKEKTKPESQLPSPKTSLPEDREKIRSTTGTQGESICPICRAIPASLVICTGRDEEFPAPVKRLRHLGLGMREDFFECPECAALYLWKSLPQYFGSGSGDEESLTRFSGDTTEFIHFYFQHARDRLPEAQSRVKDLFGRFDWDGFQLFLNQLANRQPEVFQLFVPLLAEKLSMGGDPDLGAILCNFVYGNPDRARFLLGILQGFPEKSPNAAFLHCWKRCTEALPRHRRK